MRRKTVNFIRTARHMRRRNKQLIMLLCDLVAIPGALWTAISLRNGEPAILSPELSWLYATVVLATIPVFVKAGLYRAMIRFAGIEVVKVIAFGVGFSTFVLICANTLVS